MVQSGKTHAVVEATSHGLSHRSCRLADVSFQVGVFTNLSPEHLEFHGSIEQYRNDKANLFRALPGGSETSFGVVNDDDTHTPFFRKAAAAPVFGFSLRDGRGSLWARDVALGSTGSRFQMCDATGCAAAHLPVPGGFNVENALAAVLTVSRLLGEGLEIVASRLPQLRSIPGRLSPVHAGQPFGVVVDFAHTPGSFAKLLPAMRSRTPGKLIVVFGSAGERDRGKRPLQGELAARYADRAILTDEDPRGEDSMAIIEEIAAGCGSMQRGADLLLIPNRREAIRVALEMAAPDDTVLLLGKGHESSIAQADGPRPWDEAQVAREILAKLGYAAPVP
jgi:UDP-N-acetylmuramoyl-L-alanyl-D-glutamate--2,6-diaminopimelate ligase